MKTFTDTASRTGTISLNLGTALAVKAKLARFEEWHEVTA